MKLFLTHSVLWHLLCCLHWILWVFLKVITGSFCLCCLIFKVLGRRFSFVFYWKLSVKRLYHYTTCVLLCQDAFEKNLKFFCFAFFSNLQLCNLCKSSEKARLWYHASEVKKTAWILAFRHFLSRALRSALIYIITQSPSCQHFFWIFSNFFSVFAAGLYRHEMMSYGPRLLYIMKCCFAKGLVIFL